MTASPFPLSQPLAVTGMRARSRSRDLLEVVVGFGLIVGVIWSPEHLQKILTPFVFVITFALVLTRRRGYDDLGLGRRGLVESLWILPAAIGLALVSMWVAAKFGLLHPLYQADFRHIAGYVLWTIYQQLLLQVLFVPRLRRLLLNDGAAVSVAGALFAAAHLPNLTLTAATLIWGLASCSAFLRYRNVWALGLAQGLLGLCFSICVPDALHHHLRVGLGYLHYHSTAR